MTRLLLTLAAVTFLASAVLGCHAEADVHHDSSSVGLVR